jgi:hypothetical protein
MQNELLCFMCFTMYFCLLVINASLYMYSSNIQHFLEGLKKCNLEHFETGLFHVTGATNV